MDFTRQRVSNVEDTKSGFIRSMLEMLENKKRNETDSSQIAALEKEIEDLKRKLKKL